MLDKARVLLAKVIDVLEIFFDSKLQWPHHVYQAIFKSIKAINVN
jgi:hypothetical protein